MPIKLDNIKKVYVIGIKGAGIVAIVEILRSMGIEISGSDTNEKFFTETILDRLKIKYNESFDAKNVPDDADLVLYSASYNENNNPEIAEAKKKNLRMASQPEMLAHFFNQRYGIAVTGTHGKTTTSAMLAEVLHACGTDPGAIVGSKVIGWNSSVLLGKGDIFVAEADEYKNKLKLYDPKAVVLTSCDFDHPDFFENIYEYKKVFADFVERIPKGGFLVVWGDSVDTVEISKNAKCEVMTYGFGEGNNFQIHLISNSPNSPNKIQNSKFKILNNDVDLGEFETKLIGKHNVLNASAVIAVCRKLNLDMEKVREALSNFRGTVRRFEYIGERNGAIIIDDYAHHPEEIKATLRGAREKYSEKNIWAVFHPHTFTRTKALLSEFSQSFSDADKVIVLDIYGSARETQGGVHSMDLVKLINKFDRDKAEHVATILEAVEYLKDKISAEDVLITMGAGNVWEVAQKLKEE